MAILRKCEVCQQWRSIDAFNRLSHRCMECLTGRHAQIFGTEQQAYADQAPA